MLKDIVNRPTGAQQGLTNCREFVSKSVGNTHPECEFKVAESKCYLDHKAKGRITKEQKTGVSVGFSMILPFALGSMQHLNSATLNSHSGCVSPTDLETNSLQLFSPC